MEQFLTDQHKRRYSEFRAFAGEYIEPFATAWDREQLIPDSAIRSLAGAGYLGSIVPLEFGGQGWDAITFGLLNEAMGRVSSSLTGVITVQTMVSTTLLKWGTNAQKKRWIPSLAGGEIVGAFALTEPDAGSALQSLTCEFQPSGHSGNFILNGRKRWISFGQAAGLFLVFGKADQKGLACLISKDSPGLEIEPIQDLMGFRAARLAQLTFHDVAVPAENVIGKPGFGLMAVAPVGLHFGRLSTACSGLGLLRGCVEESSGYALERKIGDTLLGDLGMMQSIIARMGADWEAAKLLCYSACKAEDDHLPEAFTKTAMAKYFVSRAATRAASDAVQIRGASGCHECSPVARFYRDAKIMEIIEGTTQIQEFMLGKDLMQAAAKRKAKTVGETASPQRAELAI
jgi:alkylation response protein AidB-like acyl-CoA dehydrogenase